MSFAGVTIPMDPRFDSGGCTLSAESRGIHIGIMQTLQVGQAPRLPSAIERNQTNHHYGFHCHGNRDQGPSRDASRAGWMIVVAVMIGHQWWHCRSTNDSRRGKGWGRRSVFLRWCGGGRKEWWWRWIRRFGCQLEPSVIERRIGIRGIFTRLRGVQCGHGTVDVIDKFMIKTSW
jgi:hypothetical protein